MGIIKLKPSKTETSNSGAKGSSYIIYTVQRNGTSVWASRGSVEQNDQCENFGLLN